jgi:hypothetical protein
VCVHVSVRVRVCVSLCVYASVCACVYEYVSVCVRMSVWGGGGPACNIRVTHGLHNIFLSICR